MAATSARTPLLRIRGRARSPSARPRCCAASTSTSTRGEVVTIIGPSGSGKTTLLRCVNFLETYDGGSIRIDGEEVGYRDLARAQRARRSATLPRMRAETGMVFQMFNLFPHLTAAENVMLGLRQGARQAASARRATSPRTGSAASASPTSSTACRPNSPAASSSASASPAPSPWSPKILLLDEITSALDPELVGEVLDVVLSSPTRA